MKKINLDDTIVAISTPVGEGGIGIARMSGKQALEIADKIFVSKESAKPSKFKTYTVHYGHIVDSSFVVRDSSFVKAKSEATNHKSRITNHEIIDEVILTVMRAPKSYTKEDIVEINCHGGIVPLKKALELVVRLGARIAGPGEFTKRAFLNGRIDLSQAEAVLDVIRSKTDQGLKAALNQLGGNLAKEVREITREIMDFYSHIEASIDFPEDDLEIYDSAKLAGKIDVALERLKILLDTSQKGKILRDGLSTVICGKPNVGKSTLMNAFLKEDRVIVTPIPGTTRDVIEEVVNIDGIPLRIADTAGIIEPSNLIDKKGVEKSRNCIQAADLVLLLLDNSKEIEEKDKVIIDMVKDKKAIIVINKIDLSTRLNIDDIKKQLNGKNMVKISAAKMTNLGELEKLISGAIWGGQVLAGDELLVTNIRHADAIGRAHSNIREAKDSLKKGLSPELIAIDVKAALDALGEIIGEVVAGDVLDKIFGEFCIGK